MGHSVKKALPIAAAIAGSLLLPGVGTAAGAAIGAGTASAGLNYSQTHNLGQALKAGVISGGGTYAGNVIGGSLGAGMGTVGDAAVSSLPANAFGSYVGNSIPAAIGSTSIGSVLGGYAGNSIASDMTAPKPKANPMAGPAPFQPKQQAEAGMPASLSGLSGLTGGQQATNLATQGVYGGGNGPEEQKYFVNMENRKLVDKSGKVSDMSGLTPIEQAYLQRIGLGGARNSKSLLEAMTKWSPV